MSSANRESWLNSAVDILREGLFAPRGYPIPELRVSVGLPHARNQREVLIQYFAPDLTTDHVGQIYVNPCVADGRQAIGLLFTQLEKLACSFLPSETALLDEIAAVLGAYPQAALTLPDVKKQDTRMLKIWCSSCGYTCRATQRWIARGIPACPNASCSSLGNAMQVES